jgi:cation transport ATPase
MDSELGKIPELFEPARKSMRVVGQNLFVAALFIDRSGTTQR